MKYNKVLQTNYIMELTNGEKIVRDNTEQLLFTLNTMIDNCATTIDSYKKQIDIETEIMHTIIKDRDQLLKQLNIGDETDLSTLFKT